MLIDIQTISLINFSDLYPSSEINTAIKELEVMPSMRCLMTAGPALERDQVAGFNCSYLAIDHPRAFDEILYLLMNGCRRRIFS